jgi:hypothetical protein
MVYYYFSPGMAIFLTLLAASMWGSWMQVIKHRKNYPLLGIAFLLYFFSFGLIWIVSLVLAPTLLPEGILNTTVRYGDIIPKILLGGAMMSMGLVVSLHIMNSVGLLLSTAISGAVGSVLGIVTSVIQEGLPKSANAIGLLAACTVVFILAGFICNYAAVLRDRDRAILSAAPMRKTRGPVTLKIILLMILSTILVNGWSFGTSIGTAQGVPPLLTCAFMVTGSFVSILVILGSIFTVKRQWKQVFCIGVSKMPLVLSFISACCHYGGNLISIYAMPVISATLSFLFGRFSTVWTYFWGLFYREFAQVKRRTLFFLGGGIFLYFFGLFLLGFFKYRI